MSTENPNGLPPPPAPAPEHSAALAPAGQEPEHPMHPDDVEEMQHWQELCATVGPAVGRFADRKFVAGLLCGQIPMQEEDRPRLQILLAEFLPNLTRWSRDKAEMGKPMRRSIDAAVAVLAHAPKPLLDLRKYIESLDESITKKLKQLRRK